MVRRKSAASRARMVAFAREAVRVGVGPFWGQGPSRGELWDLLEATVRALDEAEAEISRANAVIARLRAPEETGDG